MTVFGIVIFGLVGLIAAFVVVFVVVSSIYSLHITSRFVLCEDTPTADQVERARHAIELVSLEFGGVVSKPASCSVGNAAYWLPKSSEVASISLHQRTGDGLSIAIRAESGGFLALPVRTTLGHLSKTQVAIEQRLLDVLDGVPILSAQRRFNGTDIVEPIVKGQPPRVGRFRFK